MPEISKSESAIEMSYLDGLFQLAENGRYSSELLIKSLCSILHVDIFVMNAGFQLIYSGTENHNCEDDFILELKNKGMLSQQGADRFFAEKGSRSMQCNNTAYYSFRNKIGKLIINVLLASGTENPVNMERLNKNLSNYLERCILTTGEDAGILFPLDTVLSKIIEGDITEEKEIQYLLFGDTQKRRFYKIVVVDLPNNKKQTDSLIRTMRKILENIRITIFKERIVGVVPVNMQLKNKNQHFVRTDWKEKGFAPGWDLAKFEEHLHKSETQGCICGVSRNFCLLKAMYQSTNDAFSIAKKMDLENGQRQLYATEDYLIYTTIQNGLENYIRNSGVSAVRLLFFPDIVALLRYDQNNEQNLAYLLFTYLRNGMDAGKTALSLFMHKNTVYNRLKMIEKILDADMDNPMIYSYYQHSLSVYFFCKKYLGLDTDVLLSINVND